MSETMTRMANTQVELLPSPRRVRALLGGIAVADTTRAALLREDGRIPVYYFPREDVRAEALEASEGRTALPGVGEARHYTVAANGSRAEDGAWHVPRPAAGLEALSGMVAFSWQAMDAWYEEDEEVFVHARDPRKRVDVVESRRRVRVLLGGETLADSRRAHFLFETGMPTRYYIPEADVRMDLLEPADSTTSCPYKGTARYWRARIGGEVYEDIVWSYPAPIAECPRIKDLLAFYNEKVDAIEVDPADPFAQPLP